MLKSLYSGVSGMKNLQTKMDVISNNIANVNTTGFKTGRVRFEDMISQSLANGQESENGKQVGLGVKVGAIDTIMTSGSLQSTGRDLDFGIESGDGSFFTVSEDGDDANKSYTRDGGFYLNSENDLVTSSGYYVLGTKPTGNTEYTTDFEPDALKYDPGTGLQKLEISQSITVDGKEYDLESYTVDSEGLIVGTYGDGKSYVLGQIALSKFSNAAGLAKSGGNLYAKSANSGEPEIGTPSDVGFGNIRSGFLEMSNVDLANEFTEMIVASRAYQANSRSITTSDEMLQELLSLKR
jgi:flagellar hook protein FlgE